VSNAGIALQLGQYFGAITAQRNLGAITLTSLDHGAPRVVPNHTHQAGFLSMLLSGTYRESVARREYEYSLFSSVFHPPQFEHRDRIGQKGARFFNVEFKPQLFEDLDIRNAFLLSIRDLSGGPQTWAALRLFEKFRSDTANDLDLESSAMNLLFESARSNRRLPNHNKCLHWAREYLERCYQQPMTVAKVASVAEVHPVYLSYLFRKALGQTLGEYLNGVRVRAAAVKLSSSCAPISRIAAECGFADQSHLTRVFRSLTGITPGLFRNRLSDLDRRFVLPSQQHSLPLGH
jgi:AraC family transcriptional regulator